MTLLISVLNWPRGLDEPAVFETRLEGCSIDKEGKLVRNKIFSGTGPAQPFLNYALLNIIGYVNEIAIIDNSLKCVKIKKLNQFHYSPLTINNSLITKDLLKLLLKFSPGFF